MRHLLIRWLMIGLVCGLATMPAVANLTLTLSVGFDGYYRAHTLVPLALSVQNAGNAMRGEFRVTAGDDHALPYTYRYPASISSNANQLRFFYVIPETFSKDFTVEFWSDGHAVTHATYAQCKDLYDTDRLLVVTGGTGSSFNYMGGSGITTSEAAVARAWDTDSLTRQNGVMFRSGPPLQTPGFPGNAGTNGNVRLAFVDKALLPDNPEAYGSISTLALMSDITENTLPADAQQAIPLWVSSGGHLLIAGGGAPGRLRGAFFTRLLARDGGEKTTMGDAGFATTVPFGAGYVTGLSFDPDAVATPDWQAMQRAYGALVALDTQTPLMLLLHDAVNKATVVHNLHPPSLSLIITFLLVYLILLVPVNYFWLKKIDKRELAWVTTPAIVLVFTIGAYGIGWLTKGHQLVLNMVSVAEATAGQTAAMATSELLIFSPARAAYRLNLGETGLLLHEFAPNDNTNNYRAPREREVAPLELTIADDKIEAPHVAVNMWDFRQFVTTHRLELGQGITAMLGPGATGTLTNGSPFRFPLARLYNNGAEVAEFALDRGQTIDVGKSKAQPLASPWDPDKQSNVDAIQQNVNMQLSQNARLNRGYVLVAYTEDATPPVRLEGRAPTTALTALIVSLGGQSAPAIHVPKPPQAPKPAVVGQIRVFPGGLRAHP